MIAALTPLRLEDLGGAATGYLRRVAAYNGPLDPAEDDAALLRLVEGGTPVIGVTLGDGTYDGVTLRRRMADLHLTLEILVVSGNLRQAEARTRGDAIDADPGIYQIIEDVRELLFGAELGVTGAGFAVPSSEQASLRAPDMTVWRLTYAVSFDASLADPEAGDDYYETRQDLYNSADSDAADPVITAETDLTDP